MSDRRSTDRPGGDRLTLANLLPTRESGHPGREALIERRRASWDQRVQRDLAGDGRLPDRAGRRDIGGLNTFLY